MVLHEASAAALQMAMGVTPNVVGGVNTMSSMARSGVVLGLWGISFGLEDLVILLVTPAEVGGCDVGDTIVVTSGADASSPCRPYVEKKFALSSSALHQWSFSWPSFSYAVPQVQMSLGLLVCIEQQSVLNNNFMQTRTLILRPDVPAKSSKLDFTKPVAPSLALNATIKSSAK
ncbi:hypothetical protein AKJ16_DCAP18093, partial [Drosera capensis]